MASQSLYRKWRSQTFDEMVGQEAIIDTLKNALNTNTLRHAYLFTGPRGTGKTTTARLLAKTVNCTNLQHGEPCNQCQQCREITAGISFNVIEIDAASNRGIDSIRELREKIMVPPAAGKYKIYILDEAHMLTTEAFNALLKTLEEPPDYAIFVMATTDVHKMLPTVLSRCQRFDFKRFSTRQIVTHLLFVAKAEQIELERSAAELIARTAAGGMRDALSLLDQAIAYAGDAVSLEQVQSMLGVADPRAISTLLASIAALDSPTLLYQLHELSEAGADLRQINGQIVEYWRALMLAKAGADVITILDLTDDEFKELQQLTPSFTLEELTECARIFAQNELVQKNQGAPQLGLELASLECIELHRRARRAPSPAPTQQSISPPPTRQAPEIATHPTSALIGRSELTSEPAQLANRESARHEISQEAPISAPTQLSLTLDQVMAAWENVRKRTKQKGPLLAAFLEHCQVIGVDTSPEGPVVQIRAAKQPHFEQIKKRIQDIEWALGIEFGQSCKVRLLPPGRTTGPATASYTLATTSTQTSAYREPAQEIVEPPRSLPNPAWPVDLPPVPGRRETNVPETRSQGSQVSEARGAYEPPALARKQGVSENKKIVPSREALEQKVQRDPVVQEIIRTFRATIADIQPK